jgi:hypothetical protein
MNVRFWISNPSLIVPRLRYWVWEKANAHKPWMCTGTIGFCREHLVRSMSALEFGSGRSTAWFAGMVGHLTSVEHNPGWHGQVGRQLAEQRVANVDYRFVPLDHPEAEPERPDYDPTPAYVAVLDEFADGSLDLVIVDGHYRTNCIRRAVPKIKPGGYLLVDDANMWPSLEAIPIPDRWEVVDDSTNGLKRCVIWQAPRPGR